MESDVKIKLTSTLVEVLLFDGLPALSKFINTLNDKELVTLEDIKSVRSELDSASYFKPRKGK
jgi:hypothetical protein